MPKKGHDDQQISLFLLSYKFLVLAGPLSNNDYDLYWIFGPRNCTGTVFREFLMFHQTSFNKTQSIG